jgi:GMP-PDE, delta subunit
MCGYHANCTVCIYMTAQICQLAAQDKLVREYDMPFGFCIPSSVNTWEAAYDMPLYDEQQIQEFVRFHCVLCMCAVAYVLAVDLLCR